MVGKTIGLGIGMDGIRGEGVGNLGTLTPEGTPDIVVVTTITFSVFAVSDVVALFDSPEDAVAVTV